MHHLESNNNIKKNFSFIQSVFYEHQFENFAAKADR
jgi:hypothetical protein